MSANDAVCPFCGQVKPGVDCSLDERERGKMLMVRITNRPCVCGGSFVVDEPSDAEQAELVRRLAETPDGAKLLAELQQRAQEQIDRGASADAVRAAVEELPLAARLVRSLEPKSIDDWIKVLGIIAYVLLWLSGQAPSPPEAVRSVFPSQSPEASQDADGASADPCQDRPQPQHQDDDPE